MNAITQIHPLQTSALVQSMLNAIAADEIAERLIPLSNEYQAQALDAARLDRSEAMRAALYDNYSGDGVDHRTLVPNFSALTLARQNIKTLEAAVLEAEKAVVQSVTATTGRTCPRCGTSRTC